MLWSEEKQLWPQHQETQPERVNLLPPIAASLLPRWELPAGLVSEGSGQRLKASVQGAELSTATQPTWTLHTRAAAGLRVRGVPALPCPGLLRAACAACGQQAYLGTPPVHQHLAPELKGKTAP